MNTDSIIMVLGKIHLKQLLQRTYKFRLYPNLEQSKKLQNNLAVCKWVYNKMVEHSKNKHITRNDLNYFLTELKEQEYGSTHITLKCCKWYLHKLTAHERHEQLRENGKKIGSLKFAKYGEYRTFTYNQSGFDITRVNNTNFLHLSKIGSVRTIIHRNIPQNIKQITVTKSKSGKWHCGITCDVVIMIPKISLAKSVGIDVGIKNLAYDSDGHVTPNPLNLKKMLRPLARVQRKISRRQKGSQNRKKADRWFQVIHERIKNKRKDFLHKISTQYAKKYDVIFVEKLQKMNMVQNHKLARNILDSGWGTFEKMLDYKCMLVEVPAKNTTADCSRCGSMVPKSLAVRTHRCDKCRLVLDRDYNAAINILKKGLSIFGIVLDMKLPQELREVTPVEISVRSWKQEATSFSKW